MAPIATAHRVERGPDGYDYQVRQIAGARAVKTYRCPGCDHEIRSGTAHVVVWRVDMGRGPPALAHPVLGEPGHSGPDEKMVLKTGG